MQSQKPPTSPLSKIINEEKRHSEKMAGFVLGLWNVCQEVKIRIKMCDQKYYDLKNVYKYTKNKTKHKIRLILMSIFTHLNVTLAFFWKIYINNSPSCEEGYYVGLISVMK